MNSNLQIRLPTPAPPSRGAWPGLGVQQDPVPRSGGGHGSTGSGVRRRSISAARGEVGWQGPRGRAAPRVIGSLAPPPALAPLLSQVCRTQIQRYQRPQRQGGGPAGSARPLRSPSLTWSGGWTRLWLCFAARLFLGIAADGRCRERAGGGAGGCWDLCWGARRGARRCRQLGAGTLPAVPAVPSRQPLPSAARRPWRG